MRKSIFIILIFTFALLHGEVFNPVNPEVHSLVWKSVTDPEVVYFMDRLGLRPENFAETYYQTYKCDSYEVQVMLKKDKIWNIKYTFPDPMTAEKTSEPIMKYYGLSHIYEEPDHKIWKDDDDRFGEGSIEYVKKNNEDFLTLARLDDNNKEIIEVYYAKQDDKYIVNLIYVYGEFPKEYKKEWAMEAENYYSTISEERKKDIENAFSDDPEVKKAVAQKAKKLPKPKIAARIDPELAAEAEKRERMESVITIWDDYIIDNWKITELTKLFSLTNISVDDLKMLIDKFGFTKSYYEKYTHPEKKYSFQFTKNDESFYLSKIEIPVTYGDSFPSIGLEEEVTLEKLEKKYGLCWYKNINLSPYTIHASGHSSQKKYNMDFSFERKAYSDIINKIEITLNDKEYREFDGQITFKKGESLWGDCENGKGIYKYTNGKWVVGLFKDGKKTHGYAEDYDPLKVVEEIGYQDRHPCSFARRIDNSVWGKLLTHKIGLSAMTWAFNKKDYTKEDWDILKKNYWFKHDSGVYRSPDGKISLIAPTNGHYIKEIALNIDNENDLKSLGLAKHYSKQELERIYGYEYIGYSSSYRTIMIPEGDEDKNNHIIMVLGLNTAENKITKAQLSPINPEKIIVGKTLRYIATGIVNKPGVTYQFADGPRFVGTVRGGIPFTGTIFDYMTDTSLMTLRSYKPDQGFAPAFIANAEKMRDPLLKHMDRFAIEINAFREDEKEMALSMEGYMEKPEESEFYSGWIKESATKAEKHIKKARLHMDNIFDLVGKADLECNIASTHIAEIYTSLSYFQDLIGTARKLAQNNRERAYKYKEVLEKYNKYDKQMRGAYDSLISDLENCGYFNKMYEMGKKEMDKE